MENKLRKCVVVKGKVITNSFTPSIDLPFPSILNVGGPFQSSVSPLLSKTGSTRNRYYQQILN